MKEFQVAATGHSLNYLPEYVAVEEGFFEEEGLHVTASVPQPWDLVLAKLRDGTAQAALGGIWVPSMYLNRSTRFVPFAQLSARAPLALLGRQPTDAFSWATMAGATVSMKGSNGASVGLYLKMRLREEGVDPASVNFIQDLDGAMLSELFAGGMGDYLVIDYPNALRLAAHGAAFLVQAFPVDGGAIPWSVYYSLGEGDDEKLDAQTRFARAIGRGMEWIAAREPDSYAGFLERKFPKLPAAIVLEAARTYHGNAMWTTPRIDRRPYDRWQLGIADGHLTAEPIRYEDLVDLRPAAVLN